MRYRLINPVEHNAVEQVLLNRGIEDPSSWAYSSWSDICGFRSLCGVFGAVEMIRGNLSEAGGMVVVVDCDVDGLTSAAVFGNYIYRRYGVTCRFVLHKGKDHGLSKVMDDVLSDGERLVVVPDAGSSDYKQHDMLVAAGRKVLVMDHHEAPYRNEMPGVVVVNNQLCDYPDKALTGAGVTWQVCRALEYCDPDPVREGIADSLLDLVAFGAISDMADFREREIRAIVRCGLANVTNSLMVDLMYRCEHTMTKYGGITYRGVAFGMTPLLNAVCRVGNADEKILVFESMLDDNASRMVESGKRGDNGKLVPIAEEASRVAANVKARQTRMQDDAVSAVMESIKARKDDDHKVTFVTASSDVVPPELTGLIANKLQSELGKPAFVMVADGDVLHGSARNSAHGTDDLRSKCEGSGAVEFAQGHSGAFGVQLKRSDAKRFVESLDDVLPDEEPEHLVDLVLSGTGRADMGLFKNIDDAADMWGQQVQPPVVAVDPICVNDCRVELLSPDRNPTMKITTRGGLQLLKFKSSASEVDAVRTSGGTMAVVGQPSLNKYNGVEYPQVIIDDYDIEEDEWVF